jgi:hypothetical protein
MTQVSIHAMVLAVALLLSACTLAPRRLQSPARLTSHVTLQEARYARIPNAVITVNRCFRARGLLPTCEFVPLAEYRSDEQGSFVAFIAVEGFYTFKAIACVNGKEHWDAQSLAVSTGEAVLQPFELQPYFGRRC